VETLTVITEFDKRIYNTFLKTSRANNKLPFKYRKNFDKIDDKVFICVKKLSSFFKRYPHIKLEEFFNAPYSLYPDEKYFPLDFYITLKATKAYTLLQKKLVTLDPDSPEQLNNIKQSLLFIRKFCSDRKLPVHDYINHKIGNEYSFLIHLKEHNVNVYTLLGFSSFEKNLKSRDSEVAKFIIGEDIYNNIQNFRTKLYNSQKALKLVELGIKKILNSS